MKNVRLSVVVPVAKGGILLCLESLKKQKEKIEIIIESGSNPSSNRNSIYKTMCSIPLLFPNDTLF